MIEAEKNEMGGDVASFDGSGQAAPGGRCCRTSTTPAERTRRELGALEAAALDVFVTAGTDHHRFDRLIDIVETWASARRSAGRPVRVFFQHGTSHAPQGYESIDYLPFDEMASMMRSARAVVSHAGPATIMDARAAGRVPIVLPRRHELDEHVDNHQVHFATLLHERGEIFLARNADHLGELLDAALAKPASFAIAAAADVRLRATTARIAELVEGAVTAGERPRRRRLGKRFRRPAGKRRKVLLACSTGGHLAQLLRLDQWWGQHDRVWVTFDKVDARSVLAGNETVWAHHPTTRNIPNLLRNFLLAWRVLRQQRPDIIISNGAGVAVPFFYLSRLFGIVTVYIEVYDRIDLATITGRLCEPVTDLFLLQWPEQQNQYRRGIVVGKTL
jgi:beta-1,4-N-acetylglucosaminyltransferase